MQRPKALEGFSRRTRRLLALLPLVSALVALPASALARTAHGGGSGGLGASGGDGTTTATTTTPTAATPTGAGEANVVRLTGNVNASGDGITLSVAAAGTQGHPLTIAGQAPATDSGGTIDIETAKAGGDSWVQVATATIGAGGSFTSVWTPSTSAQVAMRAVLAPGIDAGSGTGSSGAGGLPGPTSAATASGVVATSALTIPIFKNAIATFYGPGFWGHHTACGERLRQTTLGVASRTLKCGTKVAVYFKGREITVPVIDRGPFANNASWDLTMATAKALGMKFTSTIGTLAPAPALVAAARA
jgi:rare lipoprotein A